MNCPNCKTGNESGNIFCVNCGTTLTVPGPEIRADAEPNASPAPESLNSVETSVFSSPVQGSPNPRVTYTPPNSYNTGAARGSSSKALWFVIAGLALLIAAGGAYYLLNIQRTSAEALPEHLGMFLQSADKQKVEEIKKQDFTNALDGKDGLLKDDTLPTVDPNPNLILYSDGKDVPINDLRLIQLDTIKNDGTLKQLDFQAAPVEGKPEMKRLRIPDGVANGKYAFALLDGYLNEGKHKFWAFQVKNSGKSDNGNALKATTVSMKPKTPQLTAPNPNLAANPVKPAAPPPPGGTAATCISNNVVLRYGPSQTTAKIGKLYNGQKLYVISYSDRYETFGNKYSNYAYVQTESGERGWVYAAYIR
jgi:hypothetical protein